MTKILSLILQLVVAALGERLDAAESAAFDNYNSRRKELESFEETAAIELGRKQNALNQLSAEREVINGQLVEVNAEVNHLNAQILQARKERDEKFLEISRLDDAAVLRGDLY